MRGRDMGIWNVVLVILVSDATNSQSFFIFWMTWFRVGYGIMVYIPGIELHFQGG